MDRANAERHYQIEELSDLLASQMCDCRGDIIGFDIVHPCENCCECAMFDAWTPEDAKHRGEDGPGWLPPEGWVVDPDRRECLCGYRD